MTLHALKRLGKSVGRSLRDLYWRATAVGMVNPPAGGPVGTILFICKGNICRSPFAESYARALIPAGSTCLVDSAGLEVSRSVAPPESAVRAAGSFRVGLHGHRSKGVTAAMVAAADMIVAMEAAQAEMLERRFPECLGKVHLLSLYDPDRAKGGFLRYNIQDPYGRGEEQFVSCYSRITRCLDALFRMISVT